MSKRKTITVSLEDIARDARQAHAALERVFAEWRAQPSEERTPEQLDAWIIKLGESRWRMDRADADARKGSRWADRKEASGK